MPIVLTIAWRTKRQKVSRGNWSNPASGVTAAISQLGFLQETMQEGIYNTVIVILSLFSSFGLDI